MHTGTQTRIGVIVPKLGSIKATVSLSKTAKLRLAWIDYYQAHGHNARLTCRHYGIHHRTFYRYYERFKLQGPRGLEDRSHRPAHVRQPLTPLPVIDAIRSLRKANPEFSKYKLQAILRRDYGYSVSASTIGRIISRYQLFFNSPIKPKGHPQRRKQIERLRKPKGLKAARPGDLIEVDVKHLPYMGGRMYGFVAIDVITKQASIYVSTSISSAQGVVAWQRAVQELGLPKAVLTDNGSENQGAFAELLASQPLQHYWARPYTPKDKPHVERFIGTLEKECIQWGGVALNKPDQQQLIDAWLHKYHSYRPHQALNYLTPDEYKAKLESEEVAPIM
jgi:transposase InsO family protein